MKIVHITGYFVPELGYQEYYLAKWHAKMGHEVHVVTSNLLYPFPNIEGMLKEAGVKNTSRRRKAESYKHENFTVHRLPYTFEYSDCILVKGVEDTITKIKPDIVFSHESRQGMTVDAAKLKEKLGFKYVVDQHDFFHDIPNHPLVKKMLRSWEYNVIRKKLVDYNLKHADRVIAVTEQTKQFLLKKHRVPQSKITMIPLGVDTESYKHSESKRKAVRNKLNLSEKNVVGVFSGTIVPRKQVEILIEAMRKLQDDNVHCILVGTGPDEYMKKLKVLVGKYGLAQNVHFVGFQKKETINDYFSAADVGIWPGNNSVSIMEAMACSLPIVMVDLQLTHLVGFNNGIAFKQGNVDQLTAAIKKVAATKKDRDTMGKNSLKAIEDNYSYKAIAQQFLDAAK